MERDGEEGVLAYETRRRCHGLACTSLGSSVMIGLGSIGDVKYSGNLHHRSQTHELNLLIGRSSGGINGETSMELMESCSVLTPAPCVQLQFGGSASGLHRNLASVGDALRIYKIAFDESDEDSLPILKLATSLDPDQRSEPLRAVPLTSLSWVEEDVRVLRVACVDGSVTDFDPEVERITGTVVAHEKETYRVSTAHHNVNLFATASADASIRVFDSRDLQYSNILYENPNQASMIGVEWNRHSPYYLSAFARKSNQLIILDSRLPGLPVVILENETPSIVNASCWAPNSSQHVATANEAGYVSVWSLESIPHRITGPMLEYQAEKPVTNMAWEPECDRWVASITGGSLKLLRV
mmetsp:Transcript_5492/g.9665  ORF Transcript_5492/g.9665 Transcript_5492/m.9665 type:complete len:355 (-) Transcript_5492:928-1992(-)